jgi:hypothetical protein
MTTFSTSFYSRVFFFPSRDDEVGGDGDSDLELESSGSLRKKHNLNIPSNDVEDLEDEHEETTDLRASAVKIFPADQLVEGQPLSALELGGGHSENNSSKKPQKSSEVAKALAKFWDIDDTMGALGSLTSSQQSLGKGAFSPVNLTPSANTPPNKTPKQHRRKPIDQRHEALLGLQRQKVISYTQNAQLEREVEALQKQLEKIEQLEKSMDVPASIISPNRSLLNHSNLSLQSTSSTVMDSHTKQHHPILINSNNTSFERPLWEPKYPDIYPIDEEANDNWNNLQSPPLADKPSAIKRHQNRRNNYHQTPKKDKSTISSSSEDEGFDSFKPQFKKKNFNNNDMESKGEPSAFLNKNNLEPQVNSIKATAQNASNRNRRPRVGYSSGAESDDSTSKAPVPATNFTKYKSPHHQQLSDSENTTTPLAAASGSPRYGIPRNPAAASKQKSEVRRTRNTIGNDEAKVLSPPKPDYSNLEDEKAAGDHVYNIDGASGRNHRKATEKLKNINRRRHSLDEHPQHKEVGLAPEAIMNSPLETRMNLIQNDGILNSPDLQKSEEKRPIKRIIRRKRGGSEGILEHENASPSQQQENENINPVNKLQPTKIKPPADASPANYDSPELKIRNVESLDDRPTPASLSVAPSEDEKSNVGPHGGGVIRRKRKPMTRAESSPIKTEAAQKQQEDEDDSADWSKDLDYKYVHLNFTFGVLQLFFLLF